MGENFSADVNDPLGGVTDLRRRTPVVPFAPRVMAPPAYPGRYGRRDSFPSAEERRSERRNEALLNEGVASYRQARYEAATGNYVGAAMEDARARKLDNMRNREQRLERDL